MFLISIEEGAAPALSSEGVQWRVCSQSSSGMTAITGWDGSLKDVAAHFNEVRGVEGRSSNTAV